MMFLCQPRHAGIAQLVEQATENRRVPSSNLGPGIFMNPHCRYGFGAFVSEGLTGMPHPFSQGPESDRQFSNADSFATAFDEAWRRLDRQGSSDPLSRVEKLETVLRQLSDHPFAQVDSARAREVGEFRLRLHGL
jgi:hypothetical protein